MELLIIKKPNTFLVKKSDYKNYYVLLRSLNAVKRKYNVSEVFRTHNNLKFNQIIILLFVKDYPEIKSHKEDKLPCCKVAKRYSN